MTAKVVSFANDFVTVDGVELTADNGTTWKADDGVELTEWTTVALEASEVDEPTVVDAVDLTVGADPMPVKREEPTVVY